MMQREKEGAYYEEWEKHEDMVYNIYNYRKHSSNMIFIFLHIYIYSIYLLNSTLTDPGDPNVSLYLTLNPYLILKKIKSLVS